jgi:serine protease AprX
MNKRERSVNWGGNTSRTQSVNWGGTGSKALFLTISFIFLLVLVVPGPAIKTTVAKIQPVLLNLATEEPDSLVDVIVQKTGNNNTANTLTETLGGAVTRDLPIINAFAAQIPAEAVLELAQSPDVNWISFDGPVMKVSDSGSTNTFSFRSDFNEQEYGSSWLEIGEDDGPQAGDVAVTSFLGGAFTGLRIQDAENGIQGQFDLSESSSAVLSFGYRRKGFETEADAITIEVSHDGSSWTELGRLAGPATDPNLMFASYDLSSFTGSELSFRFISSVDLTAESKFYLDYVQIEYQTAVNERQMIEFSHQVMLPIVMTSGNAAPYDIAGLDAPTFTTNSAIIRDSFNTTAYNNNNGSVNWKGDWSEYDPYGWWGAVGGYVYVQNGRLTFDYAYDETITRQADLSNQSSATVSFDWQTSGLDDGEVISVLVSQDGSNFTELETFGGSQSGSAQYDISSYLSANTTIKFGNMGQYWEYGEYAYVDNVQIDFSSVSLSPVTQTARDEFSTISYANNNGTGNWKTNWVENDPVSGGSASSGYVYVQNGRLRINSASANAANITRQVDLTGSTQATLTFDWQTNSLNYGRSVSIQIAKDTTSPFVTLATLTGSQSGTTQYDISDYISDSTTIRFENANSSWSSWGYVALDNIQIAYTCAECIDASNLDNPYVQAIRADQVWNEAPYLQGQGVTVAVVDSGIAEHVDLTDGAGNSRILTHVQFMTNASSPDDLYGHGTHVAGSIAGNGLQSDGVYMGVAPKANLVDVKVIDDHGAGYTSDVVAGIQWIYENHEAYNIRVVNLSLNSAVVETYDKSPLDAALEILWFNGITVVVSVGNNGNSADGYLYAPANDPFFITVGATDDMGTVDTSDDILADFSAHGNTQGGFQKPDVLTPGTDIISLLASDDSNLLVDHPDHAVIGPDGSTYFRMSGTSMSSGIASGIVALLLQDEPGLNPDQVKYRLMATGSTFATPSPGPKSVAYLDVPAAIHGTTTATANTDVPASKLLWSGIDPINWDSVNWGSVNWGSVNWGSVNWGSVNWGSVNWGSVNWGS